MYKYVVLILFFFFTTFSYAESCEVKEEWLYEHYSYTPRFVNDKDTDFFLLVYSHSPSFCAYKRKSKTYQHVYFQCESENDFGWVIHGLWAESESAYISGKYKEHPANCQGDLPDLDLELIKKHLCTMPGTKLVQHQWEKHGSCDFTYAHEYLDTVTKLYKRFKVPPTTLLARDAMHWMKDNNTMLHDTYLHLNLHKNEFGICLNMDFEPISCPKR